MAKKKGLTSEDKKLWDAYKSTIKPLEKNKDSNIPISLPPKPASKKSPSAEPALIPSPPPLLPPKRRLDELEFPSLEASAKSRKRKVKVEAELDLHGMNQAQAYQSLVSFIIRCYATGKQATLIITGKGRPIPKADDLTSEERGVLRRSVPDWLSSPELRPYIMEYAQASHKDGGAGALYVYLKRKKV